VTSTCAACRDCGTNLKPNMLLCLDCALKAEPIGPPLKRLCKYRFVPTSMHNRDLKLARSFGKIPIKSYPRQRIVLMASLFVACDGKTYIDYEQIADGFSYSWSEPYQHNATRTDSFGEADGCAETGGGE
jgi:hypothetical protein